MKKLILSFFISTSLFLISGEAFAQKKPVKVKPNPTLILADKHYSNLEYYLAAHEYARVLRGDSSNSYAMYQLAECYRNYFDYKLAEVFYLKVAQRFRDKYPLARFWYATMLKDNGNYKKAIDNYEKYREEHVDTDLETELYREKAYQEIVGCKLAIEDGLKPKKDYGFKCLPKPANSYEGDYSPVIFENDTFLTLTSSRRGSVGGHRDNSLGGAFTDVYRFKKSNDTIWEIVKNNSNSDDFNKLNTEYNESSGSFTGDEKKYYFTRCDERIKVDNFEEFNCIVYVSYNKNGKWETPVRLNENINTPGQWNSQPSISPDGNILFFASKRPGGLGMQDIWYSTCNGDDLWGPPINLGDKINTLFSDVSPRYYADQKVLFFSSTGHGGHGGLDIFMTKEDDGFQTIINLGFPFNSNRDDFYFVLGDKKGYITSNREGGVGNDDIYTFDVKSKKNIIHAIELPDDTITDDALIPVAKESREEHVADILKDTDGASKLAQITGNITDSITLQPSPGIEVSLLDDHGDVIAKTTTNDQGVYNFNNLPNNKEYKIVLKNPDYKNVVYLPSKPAVSYTNVAVEPRQELVSKIGKLNPTSPKMLNVSGILADSITKKPAPNIDIQIQDEVGNVLLTAATNERGEYKFENLPSNANLKVVLTNPNPKEKSFIKAKPVLKYSDVPVQLVEKEELITSVSKNDLLEAKSFSVQGIITAKTINKPVSKGQVHIIDEFGSIVKSVTPDVNGKYKIENVAGNKDYKIVFRASAKSDEDFETSNFKLTIVPKSTISPTTSALIATIDKGQLPDAKSIVIEGTILYDKSRKPAANATILLMDENGNTLKTSKTDKNGYYKFSNLPAGKTYKVVLQQGNGDSEDVKYFADKVNVKGFVELGSKNLFENIYFDFDSYVLVNHAKKVLDDLIQYCKNDPSIQIELHANTDNYGSSQYNKILSANRGRAAVDYLVSKGLNQSSMVINAVGEDKSIATNESELGRQLNRRVELYVLGAPNIQSGSMVVALEPKKTLYSLANEYGMTVEELKEMNGLVGEDLQAYSLVRVKKRVDDNDIIAQITRKQANIKYTKAELELIATNKKVNENFDFNDPEYKKALEESIAKENKNTDVVTDAENNKFENNRFDNSNKFENNKYEGAGFAYYIVQPKNTLYNIARLYAVKLEGLKTINNLTSDTIYVNQRIKIDFNQKDYTITGYKVKEGDTIGEIAKKHGLTINDVLEINNLDGYILRKNMIIRLKR